jgi:hypothetical protein
MLVSTFVAVKLEILRLVEGRDLVDDNAVPAMLSLLLLSWS